MYQQFSLEEYIITKCSKFTDYFYSSIFRLFIKKKLNRRSMTITSKIFLYVPINKSDGSLSFYVCDREKTGSEDKTKFPFLFEF